MDKKKVMLGITASLAVTSAMNSSVLDKNTTLIDSNNSKKETMLEKAKNKAVISDNLNLRREAKIDDDNVILTMKKGSEIEVVSTDSEWAKVKYGNTEGYALLDYINSIGVNAQTSNTKYTVTATSLNVRSGAGTKYSILGKLKKGNQIVVKSTSGNWAKFTYNNKTAYVHKDYIKKVSSSTTSTSTSVSVKKMKVTDNLNVRKGAGTKYSILGVLKKGTVVDVISTSNNWSKIKYNGVYGYVSYKYLAKVSCGTNTNTNTSTNNNVNNNTNNNSNNNVTNNTNKDEFSSFKQEVLRLVNKERAKEGLNPLTMDAKLSSVAQIKSQEMVDYNYFNHVSPVSGTPFELMKKHGITYRIAGENIAKAYNNPEDVVKAWMNSEGHRKNIMNSRFSKLGVGVAKTSKGVCYWTQMFTGDK